MRNGSFWRRERFWLGLLSIAAAVGLLIGWRVFWFLTDDAFISFRYISNAHLGYGYTWNPPPFRPVEGYTNFLWIVLLDAIWWITGAEPPEAANYVSLIFSAATLLVVAKLCHEIQWKRGAGLWGTLSVAWALAFLLLNRTFLAWTSSGLETALFTFLFITWTWLSTRVEGGNTAVLSAYSLCAALAALTRPDGLLLVAASGLVLLLQYGSRWKRGGLPALWKALPSGVPLLLVPAHFLWRHKVYGQWFPNTYFAKIVGNWPEAGFRYTASFMLEYGVWLPALLGTAAAVLWVLRPDMRPRMNVPVLAVVAALAGHVAYYTIVVGGDHFEYRVYNHVLAALPFLTLLLLRRLDVSEPRAFATLAVFLAASLPVPWTHWALTHQLNRRDETKLLKVPVAPAWPAAFRWYAKPFDDLQAWLISRGVGMRHQEHKIFCVFQCKRFPSREEGATISGDGFPVLTLPCVGIPGWRLPHVVVIDKLGLNDYVVGRSPLYPSSERFMAHDRKAPSWYIEAFRPNVKVRVLNPDALLDDSAAAGALLPAVLRRKPQLSESEIRAIENAAWAWADEQYNRHGAWPATPPPRF